MSIDPFPDPVSTLEEALSLERFGRYLAWAGGDRHRAIELYTLNTQLSESLYTPLQMLEGCATAFMRCSAPRQAKSGTTTRYFSWGSSRQGEQLAKAKQDLTDEGKTLEPGRVVAALTFGYWTAFFGIVYEDTWRKTLRRIASHPEGRSLRRKDFSVPLTPIRVLRNRIAHHEPILSGDLPKHYRRMVELIEWLAPPAAEWCRQHCRFPDIHPAERIALVTAPNGHPSGGR